MRREFIVVESDEVTHAIFSDDLAFLSGWGKEAHKELDAEITEWMDTATLGQFIARYDALIVCVPPDGDCGVQYEARDGYEPGTTTRCGEELGVDDGHDCWSYCPYCARPFVLTEDD